MQTGNNPRALEGLFQLKLLFDLLENRHMPAGPFYALLAGLGKRGIFDDALMQTYHLEILLSNHCKRPL
jgi:hypothetical protein